MNAPGQVPAIEEDNYALPGPGGLLRAARESVGVSLRDISAQLHLDERTIDSLERDDFENLPAPTFVRGYLRGYARLLSVPVGPVLEAYDREGFRPPDLVADISEEPENTASDFPVGLVTWAVVVILVAMVVVWWNNNNPQFGDLLEPVASDAGPTNDGGFSTDQATDNDSGPDSAQPPLATADISGQPGSDPTSQPGPSPLPAPPSQTSASVPIDPDANAATSADATSRAEQVLAEARTVLTQSRKAIEASSASRSTQSGLAETDAAGQPADSAPGAPATDEPAQDRTDTAPVASPSATPGEDAVASGAQPAAEDSGEVHLLLNFSEEAWVQIVDRDEKRLYYNLAKAGQTIDVRGPQPLRVILGRTRGVEVVVDGKPFDVTPFVSKGVARFSLP